MSTDSCDTSGLSTIVTLMVLRPASSNLPFVGHSGLAKRSPVSPIPIRARRNRMSNPARGCCAAVVRAGVEGDGRLRRGAVDGVDHRFEYAQAARWQAHARADHNAVIAVTGQAALNRRRRSIVRVYETVLCKP